MGKRIHQFLFPPLTWRFLIRATMIAISAYLFFGYVAIPIRIRGISMEPTYRSGSINFCWRLRYLLSHPKRHDVVAIRFAGNRVMLLKRIVAFEGERIEFREGKLWVNGRLINEPYVRFPCKWNLQPRQVEQGFIYVIGDNRSMPLEYHHFGQVSIERIVGGPLW